MQTDRSPRTIHLPSPIFCRRPRCFSFHWQRRTWPWRATISAHPEPQLSISDSPYVRRLLSHHMAETHLDAVPITDAEQHSVDGSNPSAESPSAHNQRTRVMAPMEHFPARTFNALRLSRGMIGPSLELRIAKTRLYRAGPLGNDRGPISRDAWTPKRLSCLVWQMREEGCNTSETRDAKP